MATLKFDYFKGDGCLRIGISNCSIPITTLCSEKEAREILENWEAAINEDGWTAEELFENALGNAEIPAGVAS